ncbi:MAG: hypothetical protein WCK02_13365 [Bacteroidota bacterium]
MKNIVNYITPYICKLFVLSLDRLRLRSVCGHSERSRRAFTVSVLINPCGIKVTIKSLRAFLMATFVLSTVISIAQTGAYIKYFQSVDSAEYRMFVGDYEIAEKIYQMAFAKVHRPLERDCYMLARCYSKMGQYDSAIVYLEKSASTAIGSNRTFKVILQDQFYFQNVLSFDNELYARLEKMDSLNELLYQNDSLIKKINFFMSDISAAQKKSDNAFWDSVRFHNDTANPVYKKHKAVRDSERIVQLKRIVDFIKLNGYFGILTCSSDMIRLYLIGMTFEMYLDIKPYLLKELDEGTMMPYEFEDIIYWFECRGEKKCCRYPNEYCSESDWESLIKRRQEYGSSIYFESLNRDILGEKTLFPWVGSIVH